MKFFSCQFEGKPNETWLIMDFINMFSCLFEGKSNETWLIIAFMNFFFMSVGREAK